MMVPAPVCTFLYIHKSSSTSRRLRVCLKKGLHDTVSIGMLRWSCFNTCFCLSCLRPFSSVYIFYVRSILLAQSHSLASQIWRFRFNRPRISTYQVHYQKTSRTDMPKNVDLVLTGLYVPTCRRFSSPSCHVASVLVLYTQVRRRKTTATGT